MVFERFDPDARLVMKLAQERARQHRQAAIAPVHLSLGVLAQAGAGVTSLLAGAGTSVATAIARVEAITVTGEQTPDPHIPLAPGAKVAIRTALELADARGHRQITPVHLLGGCLQPSQPILAEALGAVGITDDSVRAALDALGGGIRFSGVEPV